MAYRLRWPNKLLLRALHAIALNSARLFFAVQAVFFKQFVRVLFRVYRKMLVSPFPFCTSGNNSILHFGAELLSSIAEFDDRKNKLIVYSRATLDLWCYRVSCAITPKRFAILTWTNPSAQEV
jgi:hypothetical protein